MALYFDANGKNETVGLDSAALFHITIRKCQMQPSRENLAVVVPQSFAMIVFIWPASINLTELDVKIVTEQDNADTRTARLW